MTVDSADGPWSPALYSMRSIRYLDLAVESLSITRRIIDEHGPRLTGGAACGAAAEDLAHSFRSFADSVRVEEFDVHPSSIAYFLGFASISILGGIYLIPIAALVAGILLMVFQFGWYLHVGDIFFPARTGMNVEAVLPAHTQVPRRGPFRF